MKSNKVKQTLKEGGTSIGTMVFEFCTPGIARLSAEAGCVKLSEQMLVIMHNCENLRR